MGGQLYGSAPSDPNPRASTTGPFRWLLALALLSALGFAVAHYGSQAWERMNPSDPPVKAALNLSDADTEDLLQHIDSAIAAQTEAAGALHQSYGWMDRALLSLDNDSSLVARRMQLARSASQAAEERVNRTREELQITKNVLIERSTHRER